MVHLSEILGLPAFDTDDNRLGKLDDVQVDPLSAYVRYAIVRRNGKTLGYPWSSVEKFSPETRRIVFDKSVEPRTVPAPEGELVSLKGDVLDRQIIDIGGRKVVRVNDVLLELTNRDLMLRMVEVGLAGAVRRLVAGLLPPRMVQALAGGLSERGISWEYVGLVEPHLAQIRLKVHQNLARLHPADVADILEDLGRIERKELVSILDTETAAQALSEVEPSVQATVVEDMKVEDAADLLEEMAPDEAADILGELPDARSEALLDAMEDEEAEDVKELLNFDEDTAGGLMTTEFFKADPSWTVAQTLQALREADPDLLGEMDEIPLVGEGDRLVGIVPLVRMIRQPPDAPVIQAMRRDARAVQPDTPFATVVERFEKYHLRGLAVTNQFGHLIGLITIEDLLSRLTQED
jgi:magnesium transporter